MPIPAICDILQMQDVDIHLAVVDVQNPHGPQSLSVVEERWTARAHQEHALVAFHDGLMLMTENDDFGDFDIP